MKYGSGPKLNTQYFLPISSPTRRGICFRTGTGAFLTKNIERMGDHATNIAETVYYIVHGVPLEGQRPKAVS